MKKKNILIAILLIRITLLIMSSDMVNAGQALREPDFNLYKNSNELLGVDNYVKIDSAWEIFANRDGVNIYRKMYQQRIVITTNFLDKFLVLKKKGEYLFVKHIESGSKGWGKIQDFIVLRRSIRNKYNVSHKAVLVNKLEDVQEEIKTITCLRGPSINATPTSHIIKILEFAHIFQYYPDINNIQFVLIAKRPNFTNQGKDTVDNVILGWVPANRIINWDTREALQPEEKRKHPIRYFTHKKDAISYYEMYHTRDIQPKCEIIPSCMDDMQYRDNNEVLVVDPDANQIDRSSWPPHVFRYAIAEPPINNPDKPALIYIPGASLDETQLVQHIERQIESTNDRDVVFLIDATMSMRDYLPMASKIARQIMDKFYELKSKNKESGILRFGAAVYRDYQDKELKYEESLLTSKAIKTETWLYNVDPKSNQEDAYDPAYHPEAVFLGFVSVINGMNWKSKAIKQIIHMGDTGNHSRGADQFKPFDIASLLVNSDIRLCSIQIIGDNSPYNNPESRIKARRKFTDDIRSIIHNTIDIQRKKVREDLVNSQDNIELRQSYELSKSRLKYLETSLNQSFCSSDKICCPVEDEKTLWLLKCLETDGQLNQHIKKVVDELATQLYETQGILEKLRMGNAELVTSSEVNTTYKPLLLPGIIDQLSYEVGKEFAMSKRISKSEIKKIGKQKLYEYLKKGARFNTKAFVVVQMPDSKQLKKVVLFQRDELENLLLPLRTFEKKYLCRLHTHNIKDIWKDFIQVLLGHYMLESGEIQNITMSELYKMQFGISFRNNHPLLKVPFKDIEQGLHKLSDREQKLLENLLCKTYKFLNKFYSNPSNFFTLFGTKYAWIEAEHLP